MCFVIVQIGDWGSNLVSYPEMNKTFEDGLDEPTYRYFHDIVLDKFSRFKDIEEAHYEEALAKYEAGNKFELTEEYKSYNVRYGDEVLDVKEGSLFVVTSMHDLNYINSNYFFRIRNREIPHPPPMLKSRFEELLEVKLKEELATWIEGVPEVPKNFREPIRELLIEGVKYTMYVDHTKNTYLIHNQTHHKIINSNTSAPYNELTRLLCGQVYTDEKYYECCVRRVINLCEDINYDKYSFMEDKDSYHYQNRAIKIFGTHE